MMPCHNSETNSITTLVKKAAPQWSANAVINGAIKRVSLGDWKGKFVILLFYPLDFTFVCPTELIAFSDKHAEFEQLGAQVLGISVDSEYSHLAWSQQPRQEGGLNPIKIPLIADLDKSIARHYGVLQDEQVALRGLFIIDPKGIVRHALVNDLGIGRSVDECLRIVKAIQFHDEHGEVCPANWTPGAKTIKADPQASKAYFKST